MRITSNHHYRPPRRLKSPATIEIYNSHTLAGEFDLDNDEKEWRDRSELLEAHGYALRSRFHKGWKPSWLGTNLHPHDCEDFYRLLSVRLIDAERIHDGQRVVLKRVSRSSTETGLAQSLHTGGRSEDPDNHCVPILEYFDDMDDRTLGFLVMPLLRRFDDPPFAFVSEVVDFIRQTLLGLRFLHCHKVAHRDLSGLNIMMDGDALYPKGFHPSHQFLNPVCTARAYHLNRRDVPSIKYYIIDYGNSSSFDAEGKEIKDFEVLRQSPEVPANDGDPYEDSGSDEPDAEALEAIKAELRQLNPHVNLDGIEHVRPSPEVEEELPPFMVTGRDALDRAVPELSDDVPYDPFLVDIFTLGNLYKNSFLTKYSNLGFLSPLVESMTQEDPKKRPSVEEAIQHFGNIVSKTRRFQLCLPLRPVEKPLGRYSMAFVDAMALIRECRILTFEGIAKLLFPSWLRRHTSISASITETILRIRRPQPVTS